MMLRAIAALIISMGMCPIFAQSIKEVPMYDYAWEDEDADYDQMCQTTEYEKPSKLMIWLRSIGGAVYVKLCNMREYMIAKWYAFQKIAGLRAVAKMQDNKSGENLGENGT